MSFGGGGGRTNADGFIGGGNSAPAADQLPLWLPAKWWTPKTTNVITNISTEQFTVADTIAIAVFELQEVSTDEWFIIAEPPVNWSGGQVRYSVSYIVNDVIAVPGTVVFELGVEPLDNNFDLNTTTFVTQSLTDTLPDSNIPKYRQTALSSIFTSGGQPSDDLAIRIKRLAGTESDSIFFVGIHLEFI